MADRMRMRMPWVLVAACVLLAALLFYVMFAGYLPAKRQLAGLENEIKALYAREADLQNRLAQHEQRQASRDPEITAVMAERDALAKRVDVLERQLAAARARQP